MPCSETLLDDLVISSCSECGVALEWKRRTPLLLEYNERDDSIDIRFEYFYLIVSESLASAITLSSCAGFSDFSRVRIKRMLRFYEKELLALPAEEEMKRFMRHLPEPELVTIELAEAGVQRSLGSKDIQGRPLFFRKEDLCPLCGSITNEHLRDQLMQTEPTIDITNWSGADCFTVGYLGVVCTDKMIRLLKEADAKGWTAVEVGHVTSS